MTDAPRRLPIRCWHSGRSVTIDGQSASAALMGITKFKLPGPGLPSGRSRQTFLYAFDLFELDSQDLNPERGETRRTMLISLPWMVSQCAITSTGPTAIACFNTPATCWGSALTLRSTARSSRSSRIRASRDVLDKQAFSICELPGNGSLPRLARNFLVSSSTAI